MRVASRLRPTALLLGVLVVTGIAPTVAEDAGLEDPAAPSPTATASAPDGLTVSLDGSGDFGSIAAAVAAAEDGATVFVQPGVYEEHVILDRDVTLQGADRDLVILRDPPDGVVCSARVLGGCALAVQGSSARVADLTIELGEPGQREAAIVVQGGAPSLEQLLVEGSVLVADGSTGSLDSLDVHGDITIRGDGTDPFVRDGQAVVVRVKQGARPFVARNVFEGIRIVEAGGNFGSNSVRGAGPTSEDDPEIGIDVRRPLAGLRFVYNSIARHKVGMDVRGASSLTIQSNGFERNGVGLRMDRVGNAEVVGNVFCDDRISTEVGQGPGLVVEEGCSAGG